MQEPRQGARFSPSEIVDFAIVGSGAAGGIIAKELATAGYSAVVLEQGPRLTEAEFDHDEFGVLMRGHNRNDQATQARIRRTGSETDPRRGFYGGGGIDARFGKYPITFALEALPPGSPAWGAGFKRSLAEQFTRTMFFGTHGTSLPVRSNSITIDPKLKDAWGLPCMRVTYKDHPDDLKCARFLVARATEIAEAAGALKAWAAPIEPQTLAVHLLGTCRMGNDPRTSVVDRYHRAHDVPNLFICDGSSMVTSSREQPTATISALAFRAGEHIAAFVKRGEI